VTTYFPEKWRKSVAGNKKKIFITDNEAVVDFVYSFKLV
jgi:hypothetical protein